MSVTAVYEYSQLLLNQSLITNIINKNNYVLTVFNKLLMHVFYKINSIYAMKM